MPHLAVPKSNTCHIVYIRKAKHIYDRYQEIIKNKTTRDIYKPESQRFGYFHVCIHYYFPLPAAKQEKKPIIDCKRDKILPSRGQKDDGNGKKKTEISKTKWVPICNQVPYNLFGIRKCILSLKQWSSLYRPITGPRSRSRKRGFPKGSDE